MSFQGTITAVGMDSEARCFQELLIRQMSELEEHKKAFVAAERELLGHRQNVDHGTMGTQQRRMFLSKK